MVPVPGRFEALNPGARSVASSETYSGQRSTGLARLVPETGRLITNPGCWMDEYTGIL